MECKQVRHEEGSLSPIGRETPRGQGHQGMLSRLLSISAWRSAKMCAKVMTNVLDSARGENILEAGDSKELVTDYFIRDFSDEEEFSADEDSESETEPAVPSLR